MAWCEVSDQTLYSREPSPCVINTTQVKVSGTASWSTRSDVITVTSSMTSFTAGTDAGNESLRTIDTTFN